MPERKSFLLRLDPAVHDALARWAADELRSTNAQIDYLLRRALAEAGRLPKEAKPPRPRGRPAGRRTGDGTTTEGYTEDHTLRPDGRTDGGAGA
ncbi:hypothetical protein SAMN05443637_12640 [Pseudonocardia thermophila]|uniref:HicB family protein n=1 Tax=Pseudonocardia thermophila TaxID=1848 RepID=A0A1M7A6G1_PSETH|nr:hypothetical protein [Pseudonocardia thermophila]SHL38272.1 hypothetical protein SAMN05443637_12640 [Pseudonocardia thermophila]